MDNGSRWIAHVPTVSCRERQLWDEQLRFGLDFPDAFLSCQKRSKLACAGVFFIEPRKTNGRIARLAHHALRPLQT